LFITHRLLRGFHLIEILITLAIISILTSFSLPFYSAYVVKLRRLEAASLLTKLGVALEEYHFEHQTYQTATLKALHMPEWIVKHYYQLIINTAAQDDYIIMAKPDGQQKEKDTQCQTLILHASGEKNISGNGQLDECW
jgi:prepilin-type N-terminal cleavage/methylation domain-containing protein